ncbi:MAG: glycosyltransferase family 39 protein, partial [Methanobacterium sp.]
MLKIKNKIREKSWIIILVAIFIFSFVLDMYVLTRYNISYGRDGPFYDLQILSIIQTGFPASNDPPLVYYLLTPFVLLSESSFIGIKIGMALMGSIMVFPAYFLTEIFIKRLKVESKIPALLSAFLITINPFYFQMIGDFMQNLVGVLFLLLLLYFTVKWFENTKEWKKYGILTVILLICGIFTHIYTGILAVVLFIALILFNLI